VDDTKLNIGRSDHSLNTDTTYYTAEKVDTRKECAASEIKEPQLLRLTVILVLICLSFSRPSPIRDVMWQIFLNPTMTLRRIFLKGAKKKG
jgi:hypothetical protein